MSTRFVALCTVLLASGITGIAAAEESPLRVTEINACREIVKAECRGMDKTFGADVENVAVFSRVEGATGEAFVTHVWSFEGKEVRRVKLPIRTSAYRTWSLKRVKDLPGKWKVDVLDPVERLIGSVEFAVAPPRD